MSPRGQREVRRQKGIGFNSALFERKPATLEQFVDGFQWLG